MFKQSKTWIRRHWGHLAGMALLLSLFSPGVFAVEVGPYEAPQSRFDVYDPAHLLSLNVRLKAADLDKIRVDETFEIEVPAVFWVDNVDPDPGAWTAVIRRKSATAIGEKISYRLKLESKVGGGSARWNNIKSFSLENGDDNNVVTEGLAWYFHRLASNELYQPGLAAWVRLTLHVVKEDGQEEVRPQGVYLNVELPDKRFLEDRGLWTKSSVTWLYKQDDIGLPELKEWPNDSAGDPFDSSAYTALNYSPFQKTIIKGKTVLNPTPKDSALQADLEYWIEMETMLRLGAVNAFTVNPDELFNHGKNFFWADFGDVPAPKRMYFPWDLDSAIRDPGASIYGTVTGTGKKTTVSQHPYQSTILNHPAYRLQYNAIMYGLVNQRFNADTINAFLDNSKTLLSGALASDPNNKIGATQADIEDYFDGLKSWASKRRDSVLTQIIQNGPPSPRK